MNSRTKSIIPKKKMTRKETPKTVTVISLQQANLKLQKQVVLLQQKNLKLEKQIFNQNQKIIKLKTEISKPKSKFKSPDEIMKLHAEIAAIKAMEHNDLHEE